MKSAEQVTNLGRNPDHESTGTYPVWAELKWLRTKDDCRWQPISEVGHNVGYVDRNLGYIEFVEQPEGDMQRRFSSNRSWLVDDAGADDHPIACSQRLDGPLRDLG